MKTQTQHTPTPWIAQNSTIWTHWPENYNDVIGSTIKREDAAAHEELLTASKSLIEFLKKPMNLSAEDDLKKIILEMNQAIARAESAK